MEMSYPLIDLLLKNVFVYKISNTNHCIPFTPVDVCFSLSKIHDYGILTIVTPTVTELSNKKRRFLLKIPMLTLAESFRVIRKAIRCCTFYYECELHIQVNCNRNTTNYQ